MPSKQICGRKSKANTKAKANTHNDADADAEDDKYASVGCEKRGRGKQTQKSGVKQTQRKREIADFVKNGSCVKQKKKSKKKQKKNVSKGSHGIRRFKLVVRIYVRICKRR